MLLSTIPSPILVPDLGSFSHPQPGSMFSGVPRVEFLPLSPNEEHPAYFECHYHSYFTSSSKDS